MSEPLTDDEANAMLARLSEHFDEPVMPVSRYCAAFELWATALREKAVRTNGKADQELALWVSHIFTRAVPKSNLLLRMIYDAEPLRTEMCPTHQGTFGGMGQCACSSGNIITGWLPTAPRPDLRDEISTVLAGRCECGRAFPMKILRLLVARDARADDNA